MEIEPLDQFKGFTDEDLFAKINELCNYSTDLTHLAQAQYELITKLMDRQLHQDLILKKDFESYRKTRIELQERLPWKNFVNKVTNR